MLRGAVIFFHLDVELPVRQLGLLIICHGVLQDPAGLQHQQRSPQIPLRLLHSMSHGCQQKSQALDVALQTEKHSRGMLTETIGFCQSVKQHWSSTRRCSRALHLCYVGPQLSGHLHPCLISHMLQNLLNLGQRRRCNSYAQASAAQGVYDLQKALRLSIPCMMTSKTRAQIHVLWQKSQLVLHTTSQAFIFTLHSRELSPSKRMGCCIGSQHIEYSSAPLRHWSRRI